MKAVALIDGDHAPEVVRQALVDLPYDWVGAILVGGTEKLRDGDGYGVPLVEGFDGAEIVVDLSDEPVAMIEQLARAVIGEPFPRIARRWTGVYHQLRKVSEDELYFRREVAPGVVAVTGAGGRGMTLAPAIAEETFA